MSGDQRSVVMLGGRQLRRHAGAHLLAGYREEYHDLQGLIRLRGLAIRSFDPHICVHPDQPIEIGRNARRLPTKGLCMFKSQQYRAKATEYGELVKTSISPEESREFQKLERRFASLITSRSSRTITTVPCTFRTMTNPAARPWPSRKNTFCGVLGRR